MRASPDTKILNHVCARSAHSCCGEWPALDKRRKVHHRSFISLCLAVQSTQHTDIVKGKYCTQAVLKDVRDNMGPPVVVTNDGVSFLYPRKKTNMQSSVKGDLASGTTIVLKQAYNSKLDTKENNELKNLERLLRGLRFGFEIPSSLLPMSPTSTVFSPEKLPKLLMHVHRSFCSYGKP